MARALRVALAQIDPTVGDLAGNAAVIRRFYDRAARAGADLVAFPELGLTGYPPEDLLAKPSFVRANIEALADLTASFNGPAALIGFVDRDDDGHLYNAAAMLAGGTCVGVYHKMQLPNYGVFDEKRHFTAGASYEMFRIEGVNVAVTICEDAWIGDGPVREFARRGAEVIVNINASPYHMNKSFERQVLFRQRALDNQVFFLYVQTVGGQDELVFDGDSLVYDARGKLLARGAQFEEDLLVVDLALSGKTRALRMRTVPIPVPVSHAADREELPARRRGPAMDPVEEVYHALVLGTRDYIRKNGFTGAVLGLSGGIDSSLTAVIACDAVGSENVIGIAMPSAISAPESLEDAKELATNLGMDLRVVPIAGVNDAFLAALAEPFAGYAPDITEENLQARIRGTIVMAFSNKFGHMAISTGNKSELATGYATLYGDMAGGFAVLKDVLKTFVYELAAWRNSYGIAAIPEQVFTKEPTAELRPGQLDTDSLPPYETLDPILAAYVVDERSVREMLLSGYDETTVRRVVDMVDHSEYKRRQAAPGVKITARAFGKDRRLPITNRFQPPGAVRARTGPGETDGRNA